MWNPVVTHSSSWLDCIVHTNWYFFARRELLDTKKNKKKETKDLNQWMTFSCSSTKIHLFAFLGVLWGVLACFFDFPLLLSSSVFDSSSFTSFAVGRFLGVFTTLGGVCGMVKIEACSSGFPGFIFRKPIMGAPPRNSFTLSMSISRGVDWTNAAWIFSCSKHASYSVWSILAESYTLLRLCSHLILAHVRMPLLWLSAGHFWKALSKCVDHDCFEAGIDGQYCCIVHWLSKVLSYNCIIEEVIAGDYAIFLSVDHCC